MFVSWRRRGSLGVRHLLPRVARLRQVNAEHLLNRKVEGFRSMEALNSVCGGVPVIALTSAGTGSRALLMFSVACADIFMSMLANTRMFMQQVLCAQTSLLENVVVSQIRTWASFSSQHSVETRS